MLDAGHSKHFEGIIASKGLLLVNTSTTYWVLAHYQQAICYQKLQQSTQARQRYQEFLSLWKDADPDVTQIREATHQAGLLSSGVGTVR